MLKHSQLAQERCSGQQEDGFILLAVLFLVALILIGLAVAAPKIARSIQRDKDIELVHRGEQYKRAIQLYYRKYGAYPTSVDQLLNTNNIRFLRKRYKDPITGKDDWRLIHLGQAKVPPMGPFGKPLMGLPGLTGAQMTAAATAGTPGANGQTAASSSPFGSITVDTPDNSNTDSSDSGDNSNSVEDAESHPSVTITGATPTAQTPTPGNTTTGATPAATSPFGGSAGSDQTFGGGPIVGVGIPITKPSLVVYKKQKHYNQWEFVYNPIEEQMQGAGLAGVGGTTPNGTAGTTGGIGIGNGIGQPTSGSSSPNTGMGNSSSDGNSGAFGTSPPSANPQQPQQ